MVLSNTVFLSQIVPSLVLTIYAVINLYFASFCRNEVQTVLKRSMRPPLIIKTKKLDLLLVEDKDYRFDKWEKHLEGDRNPLWTSWTRCALQKNICVDAEELDEKNKQNDKVHENFRNYEIQNNSSLLLRIKELTCV